MWGKSILVGCFFNYQALNLYFKIVWYSLKCSFTFEKYRSSQHLLFFILTAKAELPPLNSRAELEGQEICVVALQTPISCVILQMLTLTCFHCLMYKMKNMKQKGEWSIHGWCSVLQWQVSDKNVIIYINPFSIIYSLLVKFS